MPDPVTGTTEREWIEVGQVWVRQSGAPLEAKVTRLNKPQPGWCMAAMTYGDGDYGERPMPMALLNGEQFKLAASRG